MIVTESCRQMRGAMKAWNEYIPEHPAEHWDGLLFNPDLVSRLGRRDTRYRVKGILVPDKAGGVNHR